MGTTTGSPRALTLLQADAGSLDWWDGHPYDHVLLDAPCSGSGTLRRHPDIKILRQAADLENYADQQGALLANLWHVLRAGGTLLYCTCSLFAKENDEVISAFTASQDDAVLVPFELDTGRPTRCGWQLLPTDTDTDGFYYSRLRRIEP
jgi:16S rRNA (cytosine967-C5)-methyltransferase